MPDQVGSKAMSVVYCPKCNHRTYTTIRYGEVGVHCKFCGHDFEVVIRARGEANGNNEEAEEMARA